MGDNGRLASIRLKDIPVVDSFQYGGSNQVPAKVTLSATWRATGPVRNLGKGSHVPPTSRKAFLGRFSDTEGTGDFSGSEIGFRFHSHDAHIVWGEMGNEINGAYLGG